MLKIKGMMKVENIRIRNSVVPHLVLRSMLQFNIHQTLIMMELELFLTYGIFLLNLLNTLQVE